MDGQIPGGGEWHTMPLSPSHQASFDAMLQRPDARASLQTAYHAASTFWHENDETPLTVITGVVRIPELSTYPEAASIGEATHPAKVLEKVITNIGGIAGLGTLKLVDLLRVLHPNERPQHHLAVVQGELPNPEAVLEMKRLSVLHTTLASNRMKLGLGFLTLRPNSSETSIGFGDPHAGRLVRTCIPMGAVTINARPTQKYL